MGRRPCRLISDLTASQPWCAATPAPCPTTHSTPLSAFRRFSRSPFCNPVRCPPRRLGRPKPSFTLSLSVSRLLPFLPPPFASCSSQLSGRTPCGIHRPLGRGWREGGGTPCLSIPARTRPSQLGCLSFSLSLSLSLPLPSKEFGYPCHSR